MQKLKDDQQHQQQTHVVKGSFSQANYVNSLPICLVVDQERYIKNVPWVHDHDAKKKSPTDQKGWLTEGSSINHVDI